MKDVIGGLIGLVVILLAVGLTISVVVWSFTNLSTLLFILAGLISMYMLIAFISWAFKTIAQKIVSSGQLDLNSKHSIIGNICLVTCIASATAFFITYNSVYAVIGAASLIVAHISFTRHSMPKKTR